jgi:hypothetical protein
MKSTPHARNSSYALRQFSLHGRDGCPKPSVVVAALLLAMFHVARRLLSCHPERVEGSLLLPCSRLASSLSKASPCPDVHNVRVSNDDHDHIASIIRLAPDVLRGSSWHDPHAIVAGGESYPGRGTLVT